MATACKKMDVDPCHAYIQEALKDNRCTLQEMSIRQVVRDRRLQARDQETDSPDHIAHAAALSEQMVSMGDGAHLAPIVVFLVDRKHYVADGFHRLTAYSKLRRTSIKAYVVKGSWSDAIRFAAMANQRNTAKPRSRADIKKAIEVLLQEDEFRLWGDQTIAKHVGTTGGTVTKVRASLAAEQGIAIPDVLVRGDGTLYPRRRTAPTQPRTITETRIGSHRRYTATVGGKQFTSSSRDEVAAKCDAAVVSIANINAVIRDTHSLASFLARRNISCKTVLVPGLSRPQQCACSSVGNLVVGRHDPDVEPALWRAVGAVLFARKYEGGNLNPVILCDTSRGPQEARSLVAEHLGIEFMTPGELVERIKSEEVK